MKFLYERTLTFRSFIPGEVPLCMQGVHWDTPPSRKLQQTTKRYFETIPQVACLLDNSCIFFLTYNMVAFKPIASHIKR